MICSTRWLSSGLPGTIAALAALAPLEHAVERRHHVAAARLGRLVAALALRLEDRPDLLVVADRRVCAFVRRLLRLTPYAAAARDTPTPAAKAATATTAARPAALPPHSRLIGTIVLCSPVMQAAVGRCYAGVRLLPRQSLVMDDRAREVLGMIPFEVVDSIVQVAPSNPFSAAYAHVSPMNRKTRTPSIDDHVGGFCW